MWQDRKGVKAEARVSMDPLDAIAQQQAKRQNEIFLPLNLRSGPSLSPFFLCLLPLYHPWYNTKERKGMKRRGLFVFISSNTTCLPSWLGQREFVNMLPLVCNDAVAILFMFDLSRKSTLNSIKEWYRQARGFNKVPYRTCRTVQQRLCCHRWLFLHNCPLCFCTTAVVFVLLFSSSIRRSSHAGTTQSAS